MNKLNYKKLPWKNEIDFYDLHSKDIFSKFPFYHLSMIGNTREEFSNYIINKVGINEGSKVIDAGCGGGYFTNTINDICDVVGISTSGECIKQAKLNYPKMNNDMYDKASKYHKARFTLPYDDVNFIFPAELMFIKK
jgi:2-polyprenyl-3-methyl-5-hydroxy-6-metoxy-1,4-benzoquinol methylase